MGIADQRREYETAGLDRADLAPDPIAQWQRWYDEAVAAGAVEPNAMTVSSVDAEGHPDARFVLVRGVDARGFAFFTNLESAKGCQLTAVPWAALTFGWLELHRQVRVRGAVLPVAAAEADAYYASRPEGSRLGAWASPQSEVLADRAALEDRLAAVRARFSGHDDLPRPPFWGGFRVVPSEVEFWQGRPSRLHDRFRYRPAEGEGTGSPWSIQRLAP